MFSLFLSLLILNLSNHLSEAHTLIATISLSYECQNVDCDSHYHVTAPLRVDIVGFSVPILHTCDDTISIGFGSGQRLSNFLYSLISRLHAHSHRFARIADSSKVRRQATATGGGYHPQCPHYTRRYCPPCICESVRDPILGVGDPIPPNTFTTQPPDSTKDVNITFPYLSERSENLCKHDHHHSQCPKFCFNCFSNKVLNNQLYSWKKSDGSTCFLPNYMLTNGLSSPSGTWPHWISKFKYMYLSNSEHYGNPCYLPLNDLPDHSLLQCLPPQVPTTPTPCIAPCIVQGSQCFCPSN